MHVSGTRATDADPSKLEPKMHQFSSLDFSTPFFRQNLQNMRKVTPKGIPFGTSNLKKSAKNDVWAKGDQFTIGTTEV